MVFGGFVPVDIHQSHAHEYGHVESLNAQEAGPKSNEERHEVIMNTLRNQYYNQNADTDKRNDLFRKIIRFYE